jgi:hypothetical protein
VKAGIADGHAMTDRPAVPGGQPNNDHRLPSTPKTIVIREPVDDLRVRLSPAGTDVYLPVA